MFGRGDVTRSASHSGAGDRRIEAEASAIVPSYNGRGLLEVSLPSIVDAMERDCRGEVIVVDDASTDGTVEWLAAEWPRVRVVSLERNAGFGPAVNAGARVAHSSCLLVTNNDVEVRPGWARALLDCLAQHPETAIAGGVVLSMADPRVVSSAGIRLARSCTASDVGLGVSLEVLGAAAGEVTAVSGVSMAIRREWFDDAGQFDEIFGMYYEDVDLCLRAWREGWTVRLVPAALLVHRFGATTGARGAEVRSYYRARNRLLMAYKTLDLRGCAEAVILGATHDLATVGALAAAGRLGSFRRSMTAHARGWIEAGRLLPRVHPERRRLRARARRSASELRSLGRFDSVARSVHEFRRLREHDRETSRQERPA